MSIEKKSAVYIEEKTDKIIALQESIKNGTWDGKYPEIKEFVKEII